MALGDALKEASKAHTKWGLDGTLRDAAPYADKVCEIEESYLIARKRISCHFCCYMPRCLEGPSQNGEAGLVAEAEGTLA